MSAGGYSIEIGRLGVDLKIELGGIEYFLQGLKPREPNMGFISLSTR